MIGKILSFILPFGISLLVEKYFGTYNYRVSNNISINIIGNIILPIVGITLYYQKMFYIIPFYLGCFMGTFTFECIRLLLAN